MSELVTVTVTEEVINIIVVESDVINISVFDGFGPSVGVPVGGANGYKLVKASAENFDTTWVEDHKITISTDDPTGGADGDIWIKYTL